MTAAPKAPLVTRPSRPLGLAARIGDPRLATRLRRELEGEVLFDPASRGRYSTDASIYQVEPIGVVVAKSEADVVRAIAIAREEGVPVLPRGGGTSQIGQTVGHALVVDTSKYLNQVIALDRDARRVTVRPGLVLDQLNRRLKTSGLFFPVDVSTANRATLGGMAGNNSCGARSIRYGNMVHNVRAIESVLADGTIARFAATDDGPPRYAALARRLRAIGAREAEEIDRRFPKLLRRVGGYNLDALTQPQPNLAQFLVGSEGTLAFFLKLELDLQPIPAHRVLGVCHFPSFYQAMDATQHLVALGPSAVELVDRTMIDLSRDIAMFRPTIERCVKGEPQALLLVEFAGEEQAEQLTKLKRLGEVMSELGFPDAVVDAVEPDFQAAIWEVRKAGLNIMMSMKGDGKPVSFIEDCAVRLEDLAEYTDRLTRLFAKYGTTGTWYAHASVGCLHVRPVLNMKTEDGALKMRAIMEEALAIVREYKGSHSGEHGDGLARSEFHESMFGARLVRAFEEVKDAFDPEGVFNPGKIVHAPRFDDRALFRYKPDYETAPFETALDWSEWGGYARAVEMCNNNGACRKAEPGVMCPSYRATRDEQHLTRGRANTLRLALSGQLGPDGFTSPEMYETFDLCVSCKGCKRECPTGVDMARMKIEFLHHYRRDHPLALKEKLIAFLPRYAPWARFFAPLLNLRDRLPGLPAVSERLLGFSRHRPLPRWRFNVFQEPSEQAAGEREVVLLADTFNRYFEHENLDAATAVLRAGGYTVRFARPQDSTRPLCCGRTLLSVGLVAEARAEARRTIAALAPYLERQIPIVGLEPSCLLTLRDEYLAMLPGDETRALAKQAVLFEEFLAAEQKAGRLALPLNPLPRRALLHGHCHQKAFGAMSAVQQVLALVPELSVQTVESSCCGMAGSFGYDAEHYDVSMRMGELSLLPAARAAGRETLLVADGTSCRQQIRDGAGRKAVHVALVLASALDTGAQGDPR